MGKRRNQGHWDHMGLGSNLLPLVNQRARSNIGTQFISSVLRSETLGIV